MFDARCLFRTAVVVACVVALPATLTAQAAIVSQPKIDTTAIRFDDLVRTALAQNLRIQSIAAETRGIRSEARNVRSPFDPTLGVSAATGDQQYGAQVSGLLPTGTGYAGSLFSSAQTGGLSRNNAFQATLSQPLLRGFGFASIRNTIRSTDESIAAAEARLSQTRVDVIATVGTLYAQLIAAHQQEAVQARSLSRAEELGAAYGELRRLDKITEVDLITAQLGVTTRRGEFISARRTRQVAQDNLVAAVWGSRSAERFPSDLVVLMPSDSVQPFVASTLDEVTTRAISNRPNIEAARREVLRVQFTERVARNSLLPQLDLSAVLTNTRDDIFNSVTGTSQRAATNPTKGSVGLTLSQPLLNMGHRADRERAAAAVEFARVELADAENVVRVEVRTAYRDVAVNRELVRLATESSQLARRQYEGERARLDLGLTDIFRVLQVNDQVAKVEQLEASARLSLATAYVRMRAVVGVGAVDGR
ncbi:MAG: TolC family protein [Gemmatimonadaceae bacterium]